MLQHPTIQLRRQERFTEECTNFSRDSSHCLHSLHFHLDGRSFSKFHHELVPVGKRSMRNIRMNHNFTVELNAIIYAPWWLHCSSQEQPYKTQLLTRLKLSFSNNIFLLRFNCLKKLQNSSSTESAQ